MSWYRYLAIPLLVCLAVVITGALAQQTPPPAKPKDPAQPANPKNPAAPKADPKATQILDAAVKNLSLKETPWIKTAIWQRVDVQGLTFSADGEYRAGPEQRLYLKLKVTVGETKGELRLVSDGKWLWQTQQVASSPVLRSRIDMTKVKKELNNPEATLELRENFLTIQSFTGIAPLLKNLRQQLTFVRAEETKWKGRPVVLLAGVWTETRVTPDQWPPFLPRECRLYLDPKMKYWPLRIEWRGPTQARTPQTDKDLVLLQMEFRNPELPTQPPNWDFSFDPGTETSDFEDKTREWTMGISALITQAASQQQQKAPSNVKQAPKPPQKQ